MTDEHELEELAQLLNSDAQREEYYDSEYKSEFEKRKATYTTISPGREEAWLYLARPIDRDPYTQDEIIDYLKSQGVTSGFIMSNIVAMARKGVYERAIKVAKSLPSVEGKDGYFEFFFDAEHSDRSHPKIRPDGSVDYQSMQLLENVEEGKLLARYYHAIQGQSGYLVDGTALTPQAAKELSPIRGTGFKISPDGCEYVSSSEGKLEYKNNEINIRTVHEVNEDVTQITGVVDFTGDVIINGNVEMGVVVRAGKTLTIEGTVEAAQLYAVGDIILKRGIQGSNKALVVSETGSVYADFIEHSTIRAHENVESNTILNSEVFAQKQVILTGRRGTVIGGYTHGKNGIVAVNSGNNAEVRTVLHAGLETKDHEMNAELIKKDMEYREKLSSLLKEMTNFVKQRKIRELTHQEEVRLATALKEKDLYVESMKQNTARLEAFRALVEESAQASIVINDKINRGTVISVDTQIMPIENTTAYMSYRNVNGVIEGTVLVKN